MTPEQAPHTGSREHVDAQIVPENEMHKAKSLNPGELKKLMTHASTQDKALYAIILTTRAPWFLLSTLTTSDIKKNDNNMSITIDAIEIPILPTLTIYMNDYLELRRADTDLLFANKAHTSSKADKAITRQAIDLHMKKYRKDLGLTRLNYGTLLATGKAMFGDITYPKPPNHNS